MLADHIAIMYKGKLVCEGSTTALKAHYGDNYIIRSNALQDDDEDDTMVWRTTNSAEATRKLLELDDLDNDETYSVVFPTLEQVFLKVTNDTAIHATGGDGFVGEMENDTVIDEKIAELENDRAENIELDVGAGTGFFRQIRALFAKRYMLLKQRTGWIGYAINLAIPIIVVAVLAKYPRGFKDLKTCRKIYQDFKEPADVWFTPENNPGKYLSNTRILLPITIEFCTMLCQSVARAIALHSNHSTFQLDSSRLSGVTCYVMADALRKVV